MSKSARSSQQLSNVDNAASKAFSRTTKNKRIDPNNEFNDYPDLFSHFNDLMHQCIEGEIEFTLIAAELNKHVLWEQHCANEVANPLVKNFAEPSTACFSKMTCTLCLSDRLKNLPTGMSKDTKKYFLSLKKATLKAKVYLRNNSLKKTLSLQHALEKFQTKKK